jgi:hypothetical protein
MKHKYYLSLTLIIFSIVLASWGRTGHRTIGKLAGNHLNPKAQDAVQELLGNESLADVASWADEVRSKEAYRKTGSWHFLNLPLGLNYTDFQKQVINMTDENVYSALLQAEKTLKNPAAPKETQVEALKFLVHFVGDLHQPMHISRAEDKGGNTIQLNYEDKGTNLHSLWDTKLLEKQGLSYEQLASKYDNVPAKTITQWQKDPLMKWLWESYEISSKLYAEVDQMSSRKIDDAYYQKHLPSIEVRIQQAGIRLAGVLNRIYK